MLLQGNYRLVVDSACAAELDPTEWEVDPTHEVDPRNSIRQADGSATRHGDILISGAVPHEQ